MRAIASLGALPPLANSIQNQQGETVDPLPIQTALNKVVDAFYVQQPQPIVDVCREAARVIMAAWVGSPAEAKDLAKVLPKNPVDRSLAGEAAHIVNRLHPRGKSAEQERQLRAGNSLRQVLDEDAETSTHLLGFILREIGWVAS